MQNDDASAGSASGTPLESVPDILAAQGVRRGGSQAREERIQAALEFGPGGEVAVTEHNATKVRRVITRNNLRGDARRTAEYLASRGKTPLESLHDVTKLGFARGVELIARAGRMPHAKAAELWVRMAEAMLPYSAAKFETIELGPQAAAAATAGHFFAARAMSAALAAERESRESGRESSPSIVHHTIDGVSSAELPLNDNALREGGPRDTAMIRAALPPKPPD